MSAKSAGREPKRGATDAEMHGVNRGFYDPLWTDARLIRPERFNTWPLVSALASKARRALEVGPGLRPRLPLEGTTFVDISPPAIAKLQAEGAEAVAGVISELPFPSASFDLICAMDTIEHVHDDEAALGEIARVAAPGAAFLVSVPLHPSRWIPFDDVVGHKRRYEPAQFFAKLAGHGFSIESSAYYGMQPKSSWLLDFGMMLLDRHRKMAMRWYNNIFMPMGLLFQGPLAMAPGLIDTASIDQVLLLCRKEKAVP